MTNLAVKYEEYNIPEWDYFISELKRIYNLSDSEAEKIFDCPTAKIIAAIPFVAGCYRPEVTAIVHLSLFVNEIKGFQKYCACTPLDDIDLYERLEPISHFRGGDEKTIQAGMDTLAYLMIEGYHKSEKADAENGVYNPFVSGNWNYRIIKNKLIKRVYIDFNPFTTFFSPGSTQDGWIK